MYQSFGVDTFLVLSSAVIDSFFTLRLWDKYIFVDF